MFPTGFDEENGVLHPPPGVDIEEVQMLSVWRGGIKDIETGKLSPVVISCWKPTKEELEEINKTGRVWLYIWGETMPPASVGGQNPFKLAETKDNGSIPPTTD